MSKLVATELLEDLVRKSKFEVYHRRTSPKAPAEPSVYYRTKPASVRPITGSRVHFPNYLLQCFPPETVEAQL